MIRDQCAVHAGRHARRLHRTGGSHLFRGERDLWRADRLPDDPDRHRQRARLGRSDDTRRDSLGDQSVGRQAAAIVADRDFDLIARLTRRNENRRGDILARRDPARYSQKLPKDWAKKLRAPTNLNMVRDHV